MSSIVPFICTMMLLNNGSYMNQYGSCRNVFDYNNHFCNYSEYYNTFNSNSCGYSASDFYKRLAEQSTNARINDCYNRINTSILETCCSKEDVKKQLRDLLNDQLQASITEINSLGERSILAPNEVRQEFNSSTFTKDGHEATLYCDNQPYITCRTSDECSDVDLKDVYEKVLETRIESRIEYPNSIQSTESCPGSKTKDKKNFFQKIGDALYKVTDIFNMLIELFISDDF